MGACGVCPAYAGMVPNPDLKLGYPKRLPRLRGDGPELGTLYRALSASAPPTRGWSRFLEGFVCFGIVCPAYAGMVRDRGG